jgi:hypothetical protein
LGAEKISPLRDVFLGSAYQQTYVRTLAAIENGRRGWVIFHGKRVGSWFLVQLPSANSCP